MKDWLAGKNRARKKSHGKPMERRMYIRSGDSRDGGIVGGGGGNVAIDERKRLGGNRICTVQEERGNDRELKRRQQLLALDRRQSEQSVDAGGGGDAGSLGSASGNNEALVRDGVSDMNADGKEPDVKLPAGAATAWLDPNDHSTNGLRFLEAKPSKIGDPGGQGGVSRISWSITDRGAAMMADGDAWDVFHTNAEEEGE